MSDVLKWAAGILGTLMVVVLCFVANELRSMRLLVTETFAKWSTHLFGYDGKGGLTADVRRLQRFRQKPSYDDLEDHP